MNLQHDVYLIAVRKYTMTKVDIISFIRNDSEIRYDELTEVLVGVTEKQEFEAADDVDLKRFID